MEMDVNDFVKVVRSAKASQVVTGGANDRIETIRCTPDYLVLELIPKSDYPKEIMVKGVKYVRENSNAHLQITLFKPHKLTVFEAEMMWGLFMENKRVLDYAGYHSCVAGKEFIENIESIKVI